MFRRLATAENQEGQVKPVPLGFLNRSKGQLTAGISSPHENSIDTLIKVIRSSGVCSVV